MEGQQQLHHLDITQMNTVITASNISSSLTTTLTRISVHLTSLPVNVVQIFGYNITLDVEIHNTLFCKVSTSIGIIGYYSISSAGTIKQFE